MIPVFKKENCAIYKGDCLEIMKEIPDKFFDLVITSPPYNIGKEYENKLNTVDYVNWCEKWIKEIYRLVKDHGSFWLNLGYMEIENKGKAIPISYLLWDKSDWKYNRNSRRWILFQRRCH